MKKPVLLVLSIALALGVTACSSGERKGSDVSKNEPKQEMEKEKDVKKEKQYIYGKVKIIVGNEIEFELAKDPEKDIVALEKKDEIPKGKDEIPAIPAIKVNPEDSKVSVGDIEENKPLVELEFTGEGKTITIPTGTIINILTERSGEGLSAIKEGTYLKIEVDDNKSENPTVLSVDVIS